MARFLRDQFLTNITVNETVIRQLDSACRARLAAVPEQLEAHDDENPNVVFSYIIRFDNKGYRVFSLTELLEYFHQAKYVERVIFNIESGASLRTNRNVGTYLELRMDQRDPGNCALTVSSDNGDWVDASFSSVRDILSGCKNLHGWARGSLSSLAIQLGGVLLIFLGSIWAAVLISARIHIENSFLITFLFSLLVFSNLWTIANQRLLGLLNSAFPNLKFSRPENDRLHWLLQAIIGGVVVAIVLFLLALTLQYVGDVLGKYLAGGA